MWVPSAIVRRSDGSVWLSRDEGDLLKFPQSDPVRLAVLESFILAQTLDAAFQRFSARRAESARKRLMEIDGLLDPHVNARFVLERQRLSVFLPGRRRVDLTQMSRDTGAVLETMAGGAPGRAGEAPPTSRQKFDKVVTDLVGAGALSPMPGTIRFGDFGRLWPFSQRFGLDRGGPVDRYYLQRFVRSIRPVVRGRCLEIGGSLWNNLIYRFDVDEFRTLELEQSKVADLVGDAADRGVLDPASWDSILAFHMLEHCPNPFAVVSNMWAWLKPNGHACIAVPCAQRVHNYPGDYWRFMPDGLKVLFRDFSEVDVSTYGNPLTVVSNYLGLSHTELVAEDMDAVHPDYPVLACVVARK